jgi:BolA protein
MTASTLSEQRMALVRARLQDLHPTVLAIEDESHLHAGHAGAQNGASHFRIKITAPGFTGLTSVAAHRLVYHRLHDLIPFPLHAVALEIKLSE